MKQGYLSVRSAAKNLGIHRTTLTGWLERGEWIMWTRFPSGRIGIHRDEVARVKELLTRRHVPRGNTDQTDTSDQTDTYPSD